MLIPDDYITNIQERLNLYTQLDQIKTEEVLQKFGKELEDRFGVLPKPVKELFHGLRLRWVCKELGFERLILKKRKLRCYFISNPQSPFFETDLFNNLIKYVTISGKEEGLSFKKSMQHFLLVKDGVSSLQKAKEVLESLQKEIELEVI